MGGKSSPTMFCLVLAFLLYASALQLMATEDVKSTELNVLQLPVSKDLDAEKADEFVQLAATRYGPFNFGRPRKLGCLYTRCCQTDSDCIGASCGPRCVTDSWPCSHGMCIP
ncbi:uncharacterized protein [Nicotiana sylvestris]|uniref:Uncharacterized protein LOC104215652 isoform X2 n=1 Tax=Nicotiana sylvestris TaxID=4096 RepID=A0A1U7VBR1_NICSY|nr:PREDICTED: uncharacterized protein LOC104215652 isoform X2 [Nicotiana sylvestris]